MCRTSSPRPHWRVAALPKASMSTPRTAYAAASSSRPGCSTGASPSPRGASEGQRELADLLGLVGEVVAQEQPAEALQHRDEVHRLAVVAGRAQRLRDVAGEADSIDRPAQCARPFLVERARPDAQAVRGLANAVDADQRDDAAQGQHRAVAGDLRSLHARRAVRPQQLERQRHVGQQVARDLVGALALDRRDALHSRRQPRQRRQMTDGAQAIEEERQRPAFVVRGRLEPAGERAEEGARVAIAQTHLRRGAAIGDRAQRLGDRVRRRPGQANELAADAAPSARSRRRRRRCRAPARRRAGDGGRRRRRARPARRRHVARAGRRARSAPPCRRGCAVRRRRVSGVSGAATASRHHARLAALVDQDVVQLHVEMGDAGVVAEGEAAQDAGDPRR